jgi:hypothetical protein
MASINVEIDIYDFMDGCNKSEINEVIEWLEENEGIYSHRLENEELLFSHMIISEALVKIGNNILRLTVEEDELIQKLANRL